MSLSLDLAVESWPIAGSFTISRGSRTEAKVIVAHLKDGPHTGRGECVPYPRYGETVESVAEQIRGVDLDGLDRENLRKRLPAGAARNAIDCAFWDLEAKRDGTSAADRCGHMVARPLETAYTISLGSPSDMASAAHRAGHNHVLKLKLGGEGDAERVRAVRAAMPHVPLIVDANESWSEHNILENMRACAESHVQLIEQPLPAGEDEMLREMPHVAPICADESLHTLADLDGLTGKYDAVNVKLDKAGGLTEALELVREARRRGYLIMIGCMVGTSLAMAPAVILAQDADIVDLDGPLLLARDRQPGLVYVGALVEPPTPQLWG
ncbi:L-alanine-DL-glutamate epimerase-like enolase superfamily enzyme [Rhodopseudomonas julia]|uniref:Dipeptide epimerase n=1 Tax=Rhodopseudomonas julia TaxID=200617 RepID=A0ABU0CCI9_9BRAD|nr:N-acetyl-D-Glu racemase DgcA [Rhodopseudomonas julia]MDQ0326782.1 L-alanine-DL-glutamate epimerase-like enolase superfamily enzyme [Rhodopseudomonas julia]